MKKIQNIKQRLIAGFFGLIVFFTIFYGCKNEPDTRPPTITSGPVANPVSITVPAETSVSLGIGATSADGSAVKSIAWSVETKPNGANPTIIPIGNGNVANVVDMTVAGQYKFKVVVTGNNDVAETRYVTVNAGLNATVSFVTFAASFPAETINFSPATLPTGVTYTLTDNKGNPPWDSAQGFTGELAASTYSANGEVVFTQTFYLNGEKITGANSERAVTAGVATLGGAKFATATSDLSSVTLQHP